MTDNEPQTRKAASKTAASALQWNLSRRSLLGAGALLGLAAATWPTGRAFAWSSWTNLTSPLLKGIGMGDCVHEDLVQISYARLVRNHANDAAKPDSLLNPWAGTIDPDDARYATIVGDTVDRGKGKTFADADDLATRLFRENLAYLRIGSFWNDAAANTLADFGASCYWADSVPKFSGSDYYEGAWDVGQHIWETNEQNKKAKVVGLDALVQFTMNDRNNFIHGMLSSTASHSSHLKQSEVKKFALQWLGAAYEYARTGEVTATSDVTKAQAEKIFKGFIDTYGQLDEDAHDMCVSLEVSSSEASINLPHRRLRLRALGMMCHTLEDFWCPAHTCRTYHEGGDIPKNSILAFSNYKLQNGNQKPMNGYHIPFDRYAISDSSNSVNWREALTRGKKGAYAGTETLANVLDDSMSCLDDAHTYFNTLGMNETIACITKLFEFMYQGTAWDDGVRDWVDTEIMPTYFTKGGQSYVCDAGRRGLHTPTFVLAPIRSVRWAYRKAGLSENYDEVLAAAKSYDAWQRGSHLFYSGKYNTTQSKYVTSGHEGASIWADAEGESRLVELADKIHEGFTSLSSGKQAKLLEQIGCNGCHNMVSAIGMVGGMLQEFSIDLRGSLRPSGDDAMRKLEEARAFFESGLTGDAAKENSKSLSAAGLFAAQKAYADEGDEDYVTSNMAIEDFCHLDGGGYLIAVRDMDSLETSVMTVPADTPGKEKLEERGIANLTITYTLQTEFEDDLDYGYVVTNIDYSNMEKGVYLVTGTVKTVSESEGSIVLDLNGISEFELAIGDELPEVPEVGDYICARYSFGDAGLDLVDYDELEKPGKLVEVTYPVVKVAGSNLWLLTNGGDSDSKDDYPSYLQVYYGAADVRSTPREGYNATVYYYDEAYGDATDAGESELAAAATGTEPARVSAQAAESELTDSATPEYLELGDAYGALDYGDEVFHVASVIMGTPEMPDEQTPSEEDGETSPKTPNSQEAGNAKTDNSNADDSKASSATTPKTGSTTSSSSATPKTDDPFSGLNGLLSVVALAGAGMAAYSARRVANERESAEED